MKSYIIYDNLGKILRTGTCLDSDYQYQVGIDEFIMEGKAVPDKQYIVNSHVVDLPTKPEGTYYFDYTVKLWIFDAILGDRVALQKRDKLLADGPDRISPLWWSSMTAEQQQEWTDYRQALLDITGQVDYPEHIVWPTKPE